MPSLNEEPDAATMCPDLGRIGRGIGGRAASHPCHPIGRTGATARRPSPQPPPAARDGATARCQRVARAEAHLPGPRPATWRSPRAWSAQARIRAARSGRPAAFCASQVVAPAERTVDHAAQAGGGGVAGERSAGATPLGVQPVPWQIHAVEVQLVLWRMSCRWFKHLQRRAEPIAQRGCRFRVQVRGARREETAPRPGLADSAQYPQSSRSMSRRADGSRPLRNAPRSAAAWRNTAVSRPDPQGAQPQELRAAPAPGRHSPSSEHVEAAAGLFGRAVQSGGHPPDRRPRERSGRRRTIGRAHAATEALTRQGSFTAAATARAGRSLLNVASESVQAFAPL